MKLKQAIGVLETHNRWRRGEEVEPMLKPSDIGNAIDVVVEYVKNNIVLDDVMVCEYCNNIGEKSKKLGRVLCDNCFDIAISKL